MRYTKFHKVGGAIHSIVDRDTPPVETDAVGFIVGDAVQADHWVNDCEIVSREEWTEAQSVSVVGLGDDPVEIVTGLPPDAWCAVGIEQIQSQDGSLWFVTDRVGKYQVQLSGRYRCAPMRFEVVELATAQALQNDAVNAQKAAVIAGGATWGNRRWDSGAESVSSLVTRLTGVVAGIPLPAGFFWTDADNNDVPIDEAGLSGLARALTDFSFAAHSNARALKDQITAATSVHEVMALDIAAGWPS